jgi:hypothetical protein
MKAAACIPYIAAGRDLWHPDEDLPSRARAAMYEEARTVCAGCPVQVQCGRRGLVLLATEGLDSSMYGGMTPDELRGLARALGLPSRKVAQHGTRACYVNNNCGRPECTEANTRYESDRRAQKAFRNRANP